ncbi:hypothetical protein D3P44_016880 [Stutzerimonas balearica]|jgi:hypothetical protein|uniref:hypothetical protein n=1 Tax=Stutzerimonas balearica TaxID=74829 RepID=UPI001BB2444F|nr:hypothetical protein [Stutzerimonas balearica]WAN09050.1 hypothetical protein D3P44_016880 [Stutzerimonas balearica]
MIKYLILAIVASIATYFLRETVASLGYSAYKDTLGALLNISSIIFAIIGAWIAIIYPRAIGRAFKGKSVSDQAIKDADTDADYLSELVEIVMVSAIVLMVVLFVQFSVPILKSLVTGSWLALAKYMAFFTVSLLTFSQLYAVFRVILANYFFLNDLRRKNVNGKIDTLHE